MLSILLLGALSRRACKLLLALIDSVVLLRVLFEEQIVCGREVVMLVVLNCLCNRLNTEPERSLEFEYKLIVHGPSHVVVVVGLTFRLMELVPWVVLQPLYVDALLWIGLENLRQDVLRFWRQELRKIIVCIQNLLVEI